MAGRSRDTLLLALIGLLLLLYVGSYAALSWRGAYVALSDGPDVAITWIPHGFMEEDTRTGIPLYDGYPIRNRPALRDVLWIPYCPLWWLDRHCWHKDIEQVWAVY